VRKAFETLLETAKTEVEKCNALRSQHPPELQAHETSDTSVSSTELVTKYSKHTPQPSLAIGLEPQSKTTLSATSIESSQAPPKIVDIEVDDDDESDDDFVMPPVRLTSRYNRSA
jgi:hypothetical protein